MNRRSLLSLLGLTPVAIATGAASATGQDGVHALSVKDANMGEMIAGEVLYDPRMEAVESAVADIYSRLCFMDADFEARTIETFNSAKTRRLIT